MVSLTIPDGKEIYSTHGAHVLSSANRVEMNTLEPCSHEEADTRIIVHALDVGLRGNRRIQIKSNDTVVVVLAISIASSISVDELWIAYGTGKHLRNIPAVCTSDSRVARSRESVSTTDVSLHNWMRYSIIFCGRGKKTAWDVWNVFPELTPYPKRWQHHLKTSTKSAWQQ